MTLGLDFETYCALDLREVGLDRYVNHPTFRVLMASFADKHGRTWTIDFVKDTDPKAGLTNQIMGHTLIAHNSGFERAVLNKLGVPLGAFELLDSAVIARACGAGSPLHAAGPQMLNGVSKLDEDRSLLNLFCKPPPGSMPDFEFDEQVVWDHPTYWQGFIEYCERDALIAMRIYQQYHGFLTGREWEFEHITSVMNETGWLVDMGMLHLMNERYEDNKNKALAEFYDVTGSRDLNIFSHQQLKEWTAKRGVKCKSFDEAHVERYLRAVSNRIAKAGQLGLSEETIDNLAEVELLLETKQILGGSALKKLPAILRTVGLDLRLRHQYVHCGAGATLRTSGRGVQLQNLKRIGDAPDDMDELRNPDIHWDNGKLAKNIRQLFHGGPQGRIIVGDFSSVEARGLAWLARADWKLEEFESGNDMYKVQASKMFGIPYGQIDKQQRQTGKVGELSCGYGAGKGAVKDFAAKMGVEFTEAEAEKLVYDWRDSNPEIVALWSDLNDMIRAAFDSGRSYMKALPDGFALTMYTQSTFKSLIDQTGGAVDRDLIVEVLEPNGSVYLRRILVGVYERGGNLGYYKPSERKTGPLWRDKYVDPKTGQDRYYEIYGGKMSGLLTQSLCREIFMRIMCDVYRWVGRHDNLKLIGQFHDELVLEWKHGNGPDLGVASQALHNHMTDRKKMPSFPLGAEVKNDHRYTK